MSNTLRTMRAARLHGIHDLRLEELPRPTPDPGEVLLKVVSVGMCGSDVHYYLEGRIGSQVATAPIIMGHEFSAWVAELGPGIEGLDVGQLIAVEPRISCQLTLSPHAVVSGSGFLNKPLKTALKSLSVSS